MVRAAPEAVKGIFTGEPFIRSIVPHGTDGAANGVIRTEDGGSFTFGRLR